MVGDSIPKASSSMQLVQFNENSFSIIRKMIFLFLTQYIIENINKKPSYISISIKAVMFLVKLFESNLVSVTRKISTLLSIIASNWSNLMEIKFMLKLPVTSLFAFLILNSNDKDFYLWNLRCHGCHLSLPNNLNFHQNLEKQQ